MDPSQIQIEAIGESLASTTVPENADDRAVAILAAPLFPPPEETHPKAKEIVPAGPQPTRSFRLRLIFGFSGGAEWDIDRLYFEIVDKMHVSCIYSYLGLGLGVSFRPIAPTLKGPWNDFTTTGPIAVNEFGGSARFTTAGGGPWSINYFNMMGLPRAIATEPNPLKINTGITVGLGLSSTVGLLTLRSVGPLKG